MITLLGLHAGPVTDISTAGKDAWWDKPWRSGFFKRPVSGSAVLGPLGILGDAQADLAHHVGPDKALCIYPTEHYPHWCHLLVLPEPPNGAFGENLTLAGVTEAGICIGDVFQLGSAQVQVSQPRQPCWKLARRWRIPDLAAQVEATGCTGWYFRVLRDGEIAAGQPLTLLERPHPEWPVAMANELMHHRRDDRAAAAALAACPVLSASWRHTLSRRAATSEDPAARAAREARRQGP